MSPTNSKSLNKMKFEFKKNSHILDYLPKLEECRADPGKYADVEEASEDDTEDDTDDGTDGTDGEEKSEGMSDGFGPGASDDDDASDWDDTEEDDDDDSDVEELLGVGRDFWVKQVKEVKEEVSNVDKQKEKDARAEARKAAREAAAIKKAGGRGESKAEEFTEKVRREEV
jgi:hypothetical protein